jgi:hypothetical protein
MTTIQKPAGAISLLQTTKTTTQDSVALHPRAVRKICRRRRYAAFQRKSIDQSEAAADQSPVVLIPVHISPQSARFHSGSAFRFASALTPEK